VRVSPLAAGNCRCQASPHLVLLLLGSAAGSAAGRCFPCWAALDHGVPRPFRFNTCAALLGLMDACHHACPLPLLRSFIHSSASGFCSSTSAVTPSLVHAALTPIPSSACALPSSLSGGYAYAALSRPTSTINLLTPPVTRARVPSSLILLTLKRRCAAFSSATLRLLPRHANAPLFIRTGHGWHGAGGGRCSHAVAAYTDC